MADGRDARIAQLEAELRRRDAELREARAATVSRDHALAEALEQQTATSEILRVIASSPTDLQRVIEAVAETAVRLCGADGALVQHEVGGQLTMLGAAGVERFREFVDRWQAGEGARISFDRRSISARAFIDRGTVAVPDVGVARDEFPSAFASSRTMGHRAQASAPLLRANHAIGVISLYSYEPYAFAEREIRLLETFADQAVIAIENARLFEELEKRNVQLQESNRKVTEALEQQTATSEVLRLIASSPTNLDRVLQAVADCAVRVCDAQGIGMYQVDGDTMRRTVVAGPFRTGGAFDDVLWEGRGGYRTPLTRDFVAGHAVLERRAIQVADLISDADYPLGQQMAISGGHRTTLAVPILRDNVAIGAMSVVRTDVRPFTDQQIAMLETFADQAVIAIENARLFQELEQRNRALAEALEQQTATAVVLRVIASAPTSLEMVLAEVLSSAMRLCNADEALIFQIDGTVLRIVASTTAEYVDRTQELDERSVSGRAILERRTITAHELREEHERLYPSSNLFVGGMQAEIVVPLLHTDVPLGTLNVFRRERVPFDARQVELLEVFADQAAIAIENARLFQALEQRNADLQVSNRHVREALEQQTATAEVLRVIASSPTDLHRVLQAITDMATRLCGAEACALHQRVDDGVVLMAVTGERFQASRAVDERLGHDMTGDVNQRGSVTMLALRECKTIHVPDIKSAGDEYPYTLRMARLIGYQAQVSAPLLRGDTPIGVINLYGFEPDSFSEQQVALLELFADQAVIAIENARLFEELQDRVDELRALGEVNQALSSSLDLQEVLTTIVGNATRLAGADGGIVYEYDEAQGIFEVRAADRSADDLAATLRAARFRLGEGAVGQAGATRSPVQVEDIETSDVLTSDVRERLLARGMRSVLAVPLLREDVVLGGLVMARQVAGPFPPDVIALLQTFATQSALAIHNGRLYHALQEASRHKSQFLANMSHELRTPLNAIIGYSEMLQEEAEDLGEETLIPDLQKVNAAGKHLLGLINDILDLSKIEAGRMDLYLETFEVRSFVQDIEAIVQPLVEKNGNTLEVSCHGNIGTMRADQTKLRQALFNLLSNAAKFTNHGTITLTVERESDEWLTFVVSDRGIGITEEQLGRLFEAFSQAEANTRSKYGGTGLGLAISRHFCRMMGGDLTVTSVYGQGSIFTVRLPTAVSEPVA